MDPLISNAQIVGQIEAYKDMETFAQSLVDDAPPFSDRRACEQMVLWCQDKIRLLQNGQYLD